MDRNSMVFIAMGVEVVGVVLVTIWLGGLLAGRYGWDPGFGSAIGAFLGLIGWFIHIMVVAQSLAKKEDSGDIDSDQKP